MTVQVNGASFVLEEGSTIAQLLALRPASHPGYAVEVNQKLIPRRAHAEHVLQPGDTIEIVTLVGGG
ncbi:MAG: sulfur carrier protein ThiS [Phycisphaerales bacterium]